MVNTDNQKNWNGNLQKRTKEPTNDQEKKKTPGSTAQQFQNPSCLCHCITFVSLFMSPRPTESKTFGADASRDEQTVSLTLRARSVSDRLESPKLAYLTSPLSLCKEK